MGLREALVGAPERAAAAAIVGEDKKVGPCVSTCA